MCIHASHARHVCMPLNMPTDHFASTQTNAALLCACYTCMMPMAPAACVPSPMDATRIAHQTMKNCPSCNDRISRSYKSCPSCDHVFVLKVWQKRAQEQAHSKGGQGDLAMLKSPRHRSAGPWSLNSPRAAMTRVAMSPSFPSSGSPKAEVVAVAATTSGGGSGSSASDRSPSDACDARVLPLPSGPAAPSDEPAKRARFASNKTPDTAYSWFPCHLCFGTKTGRMML